MVRKKFVTSVSTTKTKTYGVYDPKAGEDAIQSEKTVRVSPSTRQVQTQPTGLFAGLKRRKKPSGTDKVEQFAETYKR